MRHRIAGLTGLHEQYEGTLTLQKPHGVTMLDLGGDTEFEVVERDDHYEINFESADRSKGSLQIPREAF
jgi:hypothetical protein